MTCIDRQHQPNPSELSSVVGKLFSLLGLTALAAAPVGGQTVLLSDDLSSDTGWTYSHAGGTSKPSVGDTSEADFGFDYSAFGIPEAPNSEAGDATTRGLRLAANTTGAFGGDAVAAVFEDADFTGQYTVQVDMWLNWAANDGAGIGTTEHGGLYVGFDVNDAQNSFATSQSGAGLTLDTDGDCGNCDYILNKDGAELDIFSGQYSVTDFGFGNQQGFDETDVNTDPLNGELIDIPALFPAFDIEAATSNLNASGTQPAGAAGFQWLTLTAEVDTAAVGLGSNGSFGTTKFTIENAASGQSLVIGTVDNSVDDDPDDGEDTGEQPVSMEGGIGLMWIDFFGGPPNPPQFGFGLFDNVRVFDGHLTNGTPADLNGDGFVDGLDLGILLGNFNQNALPEGGELNGTDPVDGLDLGVLLGSWNPPQSGLAAVPEPSSALLLMFGAALLGVRRR